MYAMVPEMMLYMTGIVLILTRLSEGNTEDGFARNLGRYNPSLKKISQRNVDTVIRQRPLLPTLAEHHLAPDVPPRFAVDDYRLNGANNLLDISAPGNFFDAGHDQWSDWSECSRTCGGGISIRTRQCQERFSDNSAVKCEGPQTQYKLCEMQVCPHDAPDFREVQCSEQNSNIFGTRQFQWIPYSSGEGNSCELFCMAEDFHFFRSFGTAKDGTSCGDGRIDKCIDGKCVQIGCDGVIGSNKTNDACGVCGGNNGTCFHYQNVFDHLDTDSTESSGYHEVAVIPIGSTHILVKDYNKNYLTLKESDQTSERFIVNGNWVVSWPDKFKAAGSVLTYTREDEKETFKIIGPTTKTLHLMVLSLGEQPMIEYEYWIPNSQRPSDNTLGELRVGRLEIQITDEDYLKQILAAGFDYDAVVPPMLPETTTPTITTVAITTTTPETTTTTKTQVSEEEKSNAISPRDPKQKPTYCASCRRSVNKKRHFCTSDFVVHAQIISKRRIQRGRYIRYDVELLTTYKAQFQMMRREYMWVPSVRGSKLRPFRHYLMMGRKVRVDITGKEKTDEVDVVAPSVQRRYENRLIADFTEYWYPWRKSYDVKMSRMASHINCKRYRHRSTPTRYRRRRNQDT